MIYLIFTVFSLCPSENIEFVDESANCVIMCYKGHAQQCVSLVPDDMKQKRIDYDWIFYHR